MKFTDLLLEKEGDEYKYGCASLITSKPPNFLFKIDDEDLYTEKGNRTYGLEDELHITLLYGFKNNVDSDHVKKIIDEFTFYTGIKYKKPSLFEKSKYDVLKLDIDEPYLNKINKSLQVLDHKPSEYKYHPHLTIAYLKKGAGKKYVKKFSKGNYDDQTLNPKYVEYSSYDGKEYKIKINID